MDIGVGLPSTIPNTTGRQLLDWARSADEAGFSSAGTIDRVVFGNYDSIPALAAAAAVTERIRLHPSIIIAPFRGNGTLLAKQLASIDALSNGRLTVGIAAGGRTDDFVASETDFEGRGAVFDAQLAEMREVWQGASRGFAGAVGPTPVQPGGPPLMIGGASPPAIRRTIEYGSGWMSGGGGPERFASFAGQIRAAWTAAGRQGSPRLGALAYFALGPAAEEAAGRYLRDYYGFLGEWADRIAGTALTTEDAVRGAVAAFADAGCDELILFPCSPEIDQLERLAELR